MKVSRLYIPFENEIQKATIYPVSTRIFLWRMQDLEESYPPCQPFDVGIKLSLHILGARR